MFGAHTGPPEQPMQGFQTLENPAGGSPFPTSTHQGPAWAPMSTAAFMGLPPSRRDEPAYGANTQPPAFAMQPKNVDSTWRLFGGAQSPQQLPNAGIQNQNDIMVAPKLFEDQRPVIKSTDRWVGLNIPDMLLPWFLFSSILLFWGLTYSEVPALAWMITFWGFYISVYFYRNSRGRPWVILSMFCMFSCFLGLSGGIYVYQSYLRTYFIYGILPSYKDVLPSETASGSLQDAATVSFGASVFVDTSRAVGFDGVPNTYCVAPIVSNASDTLISYWSVGIDCCTHRGEFWCGSEGSQGTTSQANGGLRLLPRSPNWSPGYQQAAAMAGAVYGMGVAPDSLFLLWSDNVKEPLEELWSGAKAFCFRAVLDFFWCPLIIILIQFIVAKDLIGRVPQVTADEWEWNAEGAGQMETGFSLTCKKTEYARDTVHDLLHDRAYWSGEVLHDYVFHVCNNHMFISVFASHPGHPFSKPERLMLVILITLLMVFPRAALFALVATTESQFLKLAAPILILFIVTQPRNYLKKKLRKSAVADCELVINPFTAARNSQSAARNATRFNLEFFAGSSFLTAIVCVACVFYIQSLGVSLGLALEQAYPCIAVAFIIDLLFETFALNLAGVKQEARLKKEAWYHIHPDMMFGFFGQWQMQREWYQEDPDGFLWRKGQQEEMKARGYSGNPTDYEAVFRNADDRYSAIF